MPAGMAARSPRSPPSASCLSSSSARARAPSRSTVIKAPTRSSTSSIRLRERSTSSLAEQSPSARRLCISLSDFLSSDIVSPLLFLKYRRHPEHAVLLLRRIDQHLVPRPRGPHLIFPEHIGHRQDVAGRLHVFRVQLVQFLHKAENILQLNRKAFHFFLVERQPRQPGDMLHLFLRNRHGPVPPSAMSCENARLLPLPSYDSIAQTGRLNPSAPQVSPGSARKLGDDPNNGET